MVVADGGKDFSERADPLEDFISKYRMLLDLLEFLVGQATRFPQH